MHFLRNLDAAYLQKASLGLEQVLRVEFPPETAEGEGETSKGKAWASATWLYENDDPSTANIVGLCLELQTLSAMAMDPPEGASFSFLYPPFVSTTSWTVLMPTIVL